MGRMFDEAGAVAAYTAVEVLPSYVAQVKTREKDGYTAVKCAIGDTVKKSKAERGQTKEIKKDRFDVLREIRVPSVDNIAVGCKLDFSQLSEGSVVSVSGKTKGRGFQGVVKRHGFGGSPATHGHKDQLRMPGSIGAGGVQKVFKGKKMGGHMGDERVTVAQLRILKNDPETGLVYISGAIPGSVNSFVEIDMPEATELMFVAESENDAVGSKEGKSEKNTEKKPKETLEEKKDTKNADSKNTEETHEIEKNVEESKELKKEASEEKTEK